MVFLAPLKETQAVKHCNEVNGVTMVLTQKKVILSPENIAKPHKFLPKIFHL
jgi:hypothetical protein